jgi:hypothetical protein
MKRTAAKQQTPVVALVPDTGAPHVCLSAVTRKAVVVAESAYHPARTLVFTTVEATISTDVYYVDDLTVGVEFAVRRPLAEKRGTRVRFDFVASELDVLLTALSEAVALARSSGVISAPLAACAAAIDPPAA